MPKFVPAAYVDHQKIQSQFYILRAQAIEKYSELEQELCKCLGYFTGTTPPVAATIFFRISAARARREILDKLKVQKMGVTYSLYWNGALELCGQLDEYRNLIVHWTKIVITQDRPEPAISVSLKPPIFWSYLGDWDKAMGGGEVTAQDLGMFIQKCEFLRASLTNFTYFLTGSMPTSGHPTWREIFQQRLVYPPPPDHPLYQRPTGP